MGDRSTTNYADGVSNGNVVTAANISAKAKHLLDNYYGFLRRFKVNVNQYRVNHYILKDVATHYWRDVDRLHRYQNMPLIDCRKIAGYLAYWICKLQPISVASYSVYLKNANTPKFINETFAVYVVCGRINEDLTVNGHKNGIVIEDKTLDTLLYTMKYRITSGDNLALFFDMAEKLTLAKATQIGAPAAG
ncbi:hypothetical protein R80B4_00878 [Fibrobacteres bacterium R8-0-B4]